MTVFKRNLNLHFSGVEDCTICYSIISAQDRSIPTKQCRTCKNKFHASCLYKVIIADTMTRSDTDEPYCSGSAHPTRQAAHYVEQFSNRVPKCSIKTCFSTHTRFNMQCSQFNVSKLAASSHIDSF